MPRKRQKKPPNIPFLSRGPLPDKLAGKHQGLLVFTDASRKHCGGLAAVLFAPPEEPPLIVSRSVAIDGSNELELAAALLGLMEAGIRFPGQALTLFSDNRDAVDRLNRAKTAGLAEDALLAAHPARLELARLLARSTICWIRSHASCRGNVLADEHARHAAMRDAWS